MEAAAAAEVDVGGSGFERGCVLGDEVGAEVEDGEVEEEDVGGS